jgi:putative peptidoglycan lipid II flippase
MVVSTVLLPFLSQQAAQQDFTMLKKTFLLTSRRVVYILLPISLGIILLGRELVQFAFERGEFTTESTAATTGAWIAYTIGLPIQAVGILAARVYNALQDNTTLMYVSGAGIVLNIGLNWVFMNIWGHIGIALSTSGVYLIATGTLLWILRRKFRRFEQAS